MKKVVYIVTNHGTMDRVDKYSDSIKVFSDGDKAADQFDAWQGYNDPFANAFKSSFGRYPSVGTKQVYKCGDVDIEMFAAEVED